MRGAIKECLNERKAVENKIGFTAFGAVNIK